MKTWRRIKEERRLAKSGAPFFLCLGFRMGEQSSKEFVEWAFEVEIAEGGVELAEVFTVGCVGGGHDRHIEIGEGFVTFFSVGGKLKETAGLEF